MTTYAVALLKITDKEALGRYREKAADALAKHGGAVVAAGPGPEVLEGDAELANVIALLSFPDADAARAWRSDPDLAEVHALRNKAGASTVLVIPA